MKTHKIKIELPDLATIAAGLEPRTVHPALVRAEDAATKAAQALERARRELADRENVVGGLPARIQRGEVKASALVEAMRERDAAAMLIAAAEDAATKARVLVTSEEKNAKAAVDREYSRRAEQLEAAAKQLEPLLTELRDLAYALAASRGPGVTLCIEWPDSPASDAQALAMRHSNAFTGGAV